jgi:hypothetical protein
MLHGLIAWIRKLLSLNHFIWIDLKAYIVPRRVSGRNLSELEIADRFDSMNRVVEELLKGKNPKDIATELSMSRALVLELIDEWKNIIHNDSGIQTRAREALAGADQHYAMIISRAWETVDQADTNNQLSAKTQALKLVADTEQKRLDMLSKAGFLENSELADQLLDTERKQNLLVGILRDVTADCDKCKFEVARRLSEVTGKVEAVKVD